VPFCARRCSYCDFAVTALRDPPVEAWLDGTARELAMVCSREGWDRLRLDTVYVGGGTPSLLGPGAMAALRERIERRASLAPDAEWSVEANPESFDARMARDWKQAGVTRISLGAQTFHAPALRWMGRLHGPDGPERAVTAARSAGFDDIGIDLIFGLPERLGRDWRGDLERALALDPSHVSLYGLTAEPGTPLGRWVAAGRERLAAEATYENEYLQAAAMLVAAGYEHYEVSNFARPGRPSRHNRAYWSGAPYLGIGPGAHSFLPPHRIWNVRDWTLWRARLAAGLGPEEGRETPDAGARRLERLWLGLRTSTGLVGLSEGQRRRVRDWQQRGWAEVDGGRVRLTPEGWLLLDRLAVELDADDAAAT
jgi:oxygen-independent coproporphyrinogen-3 oxidase